MHVKKILKERVNSVFSPSLRARKILVASAPISRILFELSKVTSLLSKSSNLPHTTLRSLSRCLISSLLLLYSFSFSMPLSHRAFVTVSGSILLTPSQGVTLSPKNPFTIPAVSTMPITTKYGMKLSLPFIRENIIQ